MLLKTYAVYMLSISGFYSYYPQIFNRFCAELALYPTDYHELYDWLIHQAMDRYLRSQKDPKRLTGHYRHDIFRCVYEHPEVGIRLEQYIQQILADQKLHFLRDEEVKIMVCGETLVLSRGVNTHARL